MNHIYNSKRALNWDDLFSHLNRQVGIQVSEGYFNAGVNARVVDIVTEFPTLNTSETGEVAPEANWKPQAIARTEVVIVQLDAAIAELQQHRDRLSRERTILRGETEQPSRHCIALTEQELATVLAALRLYQQAQDKSGNAELQAWLGEIATDGGKFEALADIDALCEQIGIGEL